MQQKPCLWLCPLVLFGALFVGNPFLSDARSTAVAPSTAAPAVAPAIADAAPASELERADRERAERERTASPRTPALFALDSRARSAPVAAGATNAALPAPGGRALPLAQPVAAPATRDLAPATPASADTCPDPALAPLVAEVERDAAGRRVWVLRDGRRFVRNPRGTTPLLVLAADAAPAR